MPEWPNPHSSAHGHSYLPGFTTSNHCLISRPGTASCFMRNCGTKKLWMTSCDLRCTCTTLLTGTCISSRKTWSEFGYFTCQLNCLAVTSTTTSLGGIDILIFDHAGADRAVRTTRISAGTMGHTIKMSMRSEEHTSELQSHHDLVCRLLLEKKK